jgi:aspartyl-tRNA(Asn)/glutamyl-tRNA(Gln) amidotransferase subunit C
MKVNALITTSDVAHVAKLANLPIPVSAQPKLQIQLESILEYVAAVQSAKTDGVEETSQVTGLANVWREDKIDTTRTLTQEEALSNAQSTHKGYFMVPGIME